MLQQPESYKFILGARNTDSTQAAYDGLPFDKEKNTITVLPLDLSDLKSVQLFAQEAMSALGSHRLDCLFLNAGTLDSGDGPGPNGSQWCEGYVVNHLGKARVMVIRFLGGN